MSFSTCCFFFFFNDTATTEIYTLSLHDALPISSARSAPASCTATAPDAVSASGARSEEHTSELQSHSHLVCRLLLEKKNQPWPASAPWSATPAATAGSPSTTPPRHRRLTQHKLADRLGSSQSAVARIEQGGQNLTLDLLGRLSAALESELISVGPTGPTHLRVTGGSPLRGSVEVKSSKNAAVALLCGA